MQTACRGPHTHTLPVFTARMLLLLQAVRGRCRDGLAASACRSTMRTRRAPAGRAGGRHTSPPWVGPPAPSPPRCFRRSPPRSPPRRPRRAAGATRRRSGCRRRTPRRVGGRPKRRPTRNPAGAPRQRRNSTSTTTKQTPVRCRSSTFSWKLSTGQTAN